MSLPCSSMTRWWRNRASWFTGRFFEDGSGTASPPFAGRELPYLRWQPSGDVIVLLHADQPHALALGNATRGQVADGLGDPQHVVAQHIEPVVGGDDQCLCHETASTPFRRQP